VYCIIITFWNFVKTTFDKILLQFFLKIIFKNKMCTELKGMI